MGGPNGSGSLKVAVDIQSGVTAAEQIMLFIKFYRAVWEGLILAWERLAYEEIVRRGVAELFKVDK